MNGKALPPFFARLLVSSLFVWDGIVQLRTALDNGAAERFGPTVDP
jgi:hypothetical protein